MPTRAVILTSDAAASSGALTDISTQVHALTESRGTAARPGRRNWWLGAHRPNLVISPDRGLNALLAVAYRFLFPQTRLLMRLHRLSWREGVIRRVLRSLILHRADAVLLEDAAAASALPARWMAAPGRQERVFPLSGPKDLDAFLACPLTRAPGSIHRIAFVGPLSPLSGATDVLLCVAAWASQHRDHPVEIWWIGDGDLVGILDAQPLPETMTQRFLGRQDRDSLAACFAQCGILVLPVEEELAGPTVEELPVAEALAAGLVVVGSRENAQVRRFVVDGVTGWTFDRPGLDQLGRALACALGAVSDDLALMRARGREHIQRLAAQTDAERLQAALSAVMPPPFAEAASRRAGMTVLPQQAAATRTSGRS